MNKVSWLIPNILLFHFPTRHGTTVSVETNLSPPGLCVIEATGETVYMVKDHLSLKNLGMHTMNTKSEVATLASINNLDSCKSGQFS